MQKRKKRKIKFKESYWKSANGKICAGVSIKPWSDPEMPLHTYIECRIINSKNKETFKFYIPTAHVYEIMQIMSSVMSSGQLTFGDLIAEDEDAMLGVLQRLRNKASDSDRRYGMYQHGPSSKAILAKIK